MSGFTQEQRAELRAATAASIAEARAESHVRAADRDVLMSAEAQPVILRIAAATDPDYPSRTEHIALVAATAVRAKLKPRNIFASPTLPTPENDRGRRVPLDGSSTPAEGDEA